MKYALYLVLSLIISFSALAQDKAKKKKKGFKVPKLHLGEKIGKLSGNLMTGKAESLGEASAIITYICGTYPPEIRTSESKFFPENIIEGDYIAAVTFTKVEGIGMLEVKGEVKSNGAPMEYVGLGSYMMVKKNQFLEPATISVKTETGDEASFVLNRIPGIEILSVNGESSLPILDLSEDIELVYYNPPSTIGTRVKVSLITDVMGARALNHFADFEVKKEGEIKVTIPKEALANPEISGQMNAGNFNKGENWLIVERKKSLPSTKYGEEQKPGSLSSSEIQMIAYASLPVIIKGKQDEGLMVSLRVTGKSKDKKIGYEFYKPNATTGIPLSKASKFGLTSFTLTANTFKQESKTSSSSRTIGNTTYTRTTTTTTTYDFPELPASYWEYAMEEIYKDVVAFFESEYGVGFVAVKEVIKAPEYSEMFPVDEVMNDQKVKMSYKGTKRSSPESLGEIFGNLSTNLTSDNPMVNLMKSAGDVDGLLSMKLGLQIAANDKGKLVLVPRLYISVIGRDEENNNKLGKYVDGYVILGDGIPYNEDLLKLSKEELLRVCSHEQLIHSLKEGISTLRRKEVEMGYDKIWNIGE